MASGHNYPSRTVVGILLIIQVALFLVSVSSLAAISVFCSVTAGDAPPFFTAVHFAYFCLFLFGIASLFWPRGRKIYLAAIIVALMALPLQLWLLDTGFLRCNGP